MGLFSRKKENRATDQEMSVDNVLMRALLGKTNVTRDTATQIPTISSAITLISDIIAGTPIKLYKETDGKTEEIKDDLRIRLLNDDTGDTLNANQFWKAIIKDYYLGKGAYIFINKVQGQIKSLHHVEESRVSIQKNNDPIFKDYDILVNGKSYKPFDFLKILRNSFDGASGTGITQEHSKILEVAYETLVFEAALIKKGGNKKGFIEAVKRVSQEVIDSIKAAYKLLYSNTDSENVVVLNEGLKFTESSNTSVEMQLNENKETNAKELCKIFHISPDAILGKATDADMQSIAKLAAIPLMKTIENSLNRDILLEKEKSSLYFEFDVKELLKGGFKERMDAYKIGLESNVLQLDEARYMESLPALGFNYLNIGLNSVLVDPKTGNIYTPNTNKTQNMDTDGNISTEADTNKPALPITKNVKDDVNVETEGTVASISLNGAQIQSLLQIVQAVASNQLEYDSAITLITSAFPFDSDVAKQILGNPKLLDTAE